MIATLESLPNVEVFLYVPEEWPGLSATSLRFLPAGESGIDAVIIRDADSRINLREAAAVAEWLAAPSAKYHVMHESMHNVEFGEIMGGMWGCRRCTDEPLHQAPCQGLAEALASWRSSTAVNECMSYGADMQFLANFLVRRFTKENCIHHVAGSARSFGRLDIIPWCPFPSTVYRGFVGQPINCHCTSDHFLSAGCNHCERVLPGAVASRLLCKPDVMANVIRFL